MSRYLQSIVIDRYGSLSDFELGPFGPGLNVAYGPNEAGKSTVASFIGGVMFGWDEARGVRNTYRPVEGERSGSLVFAGDEADDRMVLSRARNEDGLQGDAGIVSDVDHATYRTMFSLSSDELRSLRNTSDVTARLLTAGSGTGSSPSAAFVEIEQRIASITSRAEGAQESIAGLVAQLEEKGAAIDEAREMNTLYKQEDRERAELAESRAFTAANLDEANDEIERLLSTRARVEALDEQIAQRSAELDDLRVERKAYAAERERGEAEVPGRLLALDAAAERSLRDKLEEYADELAKAQRGVDVARENNASSSAAYEALLEMDADAAVQESDLKRRRSLIIVSALITIAFVVCGVPLFVHGQSIRSLSFSALGIGLVVLGCFIAVAALISLLRPNQGAEALEVRRKDAQWVMLQDKKKLDASLAEKQRVDAKVAEFFSSAGLSAAEGSVRQARALVDEAHDVRTHLATLDQRLAALDMRADAAEGAVREAQAERLLLLESAGLDSDASARELDSLIRGNTERRDALSQVLEEMNMRYGELGERLEAARTDRSFDCLKQEYHELRCRLRDKKRELVKLLLAKRMLEKSVAAWESRSQPEVYAEASRLFSLLTDGAWTRVSMTGEGRLIAIASDGTSREIRHLSLGTCQQLYLALRIAMLLKASDVGVSIPVLADDILVNFDATRRRAAARVLVELARARQVIVFTCHRETAAALLEADADAIFLEL